MDSKLRILQFKILNNLIPINTWLVRIGKKNDNSCTFCHKTPENLEHIFFEWERTQKFWHEVERTFKELNLASL